MITSAARGAALLALTTTLALLPTQAHAEGKDADNDIEKIVLTGTVRHHPSSLGPLAGENWLSRAVMSPMVMKEGDTWTSTMELYTVDHHGERKARAGDGEADCAAVRVEEGRVTAQCTRVLRLEKGSLTLSDMITHEPGKRLTAKTGIIGGTGHYRSAYGEGYITLDGDKVDLELNVDECPGATAPPPVRARGARAPTGAFGPVIRCRRSSR